MPELRIAKLVRVSTTHLEQADSPQHQLAYLEAEGAREGWIDTGLIYRAELTGAIIMDRPDIRRLVQDAAAGLFDAIVLKSISRLGRDTLGLLMVKRMLDDLKVELIALADGYRSFRDPELIFLVHAERAQAGRQEIAKNVRAGIVQAARRGIWPAGTLPFGLRRESRFRIAADPETAPIVQAIFALRRQGRGLAAICRHLNEVLRVRSPDWWRLRRRMERLAAAEGAAQDERVERRLTALRSRLLTGTFRWTPRTVRLLLANPAYYGELRYNRTTGERRLHGRLVRRRRDEADWVTLPCPALVSRADWAAAQGAGAERDRLPRRSGASPFLLSGRILCGRCGAPMRGMRARPRAGGRGGEAKGYYVCRRSCEEGAHPGEYIRATVLEAAVLEALRAELAGLEPPEWRARPAPGRAPAPGAVTAALRDLAEARFFRREELRRGRMSEAEFRFELALVDRREAELRALLDAPPPPAEPGEAVRRLLRLEGAPDQVKALVGALVERVIVHSSSDVEVQVTFVRSELDLRKGTTPRRTTR